VLAVEPEPRLREVAEAKADVSVPIEVVDGVAEQLPAGDGSFDAVVASLMLCSVPNLHAALREMYRVLRPGGELRFLEHVRADTPVMQRLQAGLDATVWPVMFGGSHVVRDTASAIERAGFTIESVERFRFPETPVALPSSTHIVGRARRPDQRDSQQRGERMPQATASTTRLTKFYGEISPSLDSILSALAAAGVDLDHVQASDLYERDLDCHNLGMHRMLEVLVDVAAEYRVPTSDDTLLDLGCGMGGPGRFLADRFGCSLIGVDLLPPRVELAQTLTNLTGMSDRISYRVADATDLHFEDNSFEHVWMLDVSMHIRDKQALFAEIARVLRPDGSLVIHEQTGPLPKAMQPVMRQAPYIAPSLPQLIRYVEGAGLRMLTWLDTTDRVLDYFLRIRSMLGDASEPVSDALGAEQREHGGAVLNGYIETLANLGGRTGLLVATRLPRTTSTSGAAP
jgi:ubiquinone/menaquinone biosynthesis C-methylase UbiE